MLKRLIDRPIAVTMVMLVIIVLGIVSIRRLPVSLMPDVKIPYITVQVSESSFSAREMEESVIKPLRQQLVQINGLEDIVSESNDGIGTIQLTFGHKSDMDYLFVEVNEKIDRTMSMLPTIERPKVIKASASDIPAFFINVSRKNSAERSKTESSDYSVGVEFSQMSHFVEDVVIKRIEQLPEVAMVDFSGTIDDEILVMPDVGKLAQMGMTIDQFESCIGAANIKLGSLTIRDGQYSYNVKFSSNVGSSEDIGNIWFKNDGRLLQIKDVAKVSLSPAERTGLVLSDGKDAICLAIVKQSEARMSDLKKSISTLMEQFETDYPDIVFQVTRDQTQLLEYSINNLLMNILLGIVLACLVIFLFMSDFKSPALVSLTIPLALVFSMLGFYAIGLTLNIISMSGLLLGVGMMSDNSVILVDNITANWQRSGNLKDAVVDGTKEVIVPMLTSVLTTCAIFIPLVFLNGLAGAMFYDQAMAITIVLLTSYLVTITVIPVYYYQWYKNLPNYRPNPLLKKIDFNDKLQKWDNKVMSWFLDNRVVSWLILGFSGIGMVLCFLLMPKERLPKMTETETIAKIDWNDHISLEQNEARILALENELGSEPLQTTAMVGSQQFILNHSGRQNMTESSVYINCKDMRSLDDVKKHISDYVAIGYPSASLSFNPSGNIFDLLFSQKQSKLTARLRPTNDSEIESVQLNTLLSELRNGLPGIEIPDPIVKTDVLYTADPELMALYGISFSDLTAALKNALNGNRIFSIIQGSKSVPVIVGTNKATLKDVLNDTFIEKQDSRIAVSTLMKQSYIQDLKTIVAGTEGIYYPLDLDIPSNEVKEAMASISEIVSNNGDFEVSYSGSWFSNRKMIVQLIFILIIAIILLFLILAAQFESLVQPTIILSEALVDIFASLLVLWICGASINLMSMIGLIVIMGIAINDSILKIDAINRLRKSGMELRTAIITASERRLKAIIMTSLTTILAVCPFLSRGNMGADLQYPMSLVIIAGMIVGTLVSLFLVPAIYYSIYHERNGK